jgi:hypothetical protein
MLAIGIPFLALSFGVPLAALFGWAFRGRGDETVSGPSEYLAPATQVFERRDSNMGQSAVAQTPVNTNSRIPGTATRTSFGMRNR